jgi:hypothetical protein
MNRRAQQRFAAGVARIPTNYPNAPLQQHEQELLYRFCSDERMQVVWDFMTTADEDQIACFVFELLQVVDAAPFLSFVAEAYQSSRVDLVRLQKTAQRLLAEYSAYTGAMPFRLCHSKKVVVEESPRWASTLQELDATLSAWCADLTEGRKRFPRKLGDGHAVGVRSLAAFIRENSESNRQCYDVVAALANVLSVKFFGWKKSSAAPALQAAPSTE